jgi:large subunit ribosomal protein L21
MYAIIKTGGKQFRVKKGDVIHVERLAAEAGSDVEFNDVLFLQDGETPVVGKPTVENCTVKAELLSEVKGPKVVAFKYKRRKRYRRKVGHRQKYSQVRILDIVK